ncbi:MAG: hypothetical protein KDB26_14650 [Microthrixaceae bacterium]|nr:hypothetical protein [Microthrixaceae bacterium]
MDTDAAPYTFTWTPHSDDDPVTVPMFDLTPADLCDAGANTDMPHELFASIFIYRTLFHVCYALLTEDTATVEVAEYGTVVVERAP